MLIFFNTYLPYIVYGLTFIFTIFSIGYLNKRYNLSRNQVYIFFSFFLFWSASIIIRAYRKSYALNDLAAGGLNLGHEAAANIAAAYGLISFFTRFLVFYLADRFRSKKAMIYLALALLGLSDLYVLFYAGYNSLYINSLALGLNASMLTIFNLLFGEGLSRVELIKSVSLLSVAPLMAEFAMSSFQAHFTTKGQENYQPLFVLSFVFALLAIFYLFKIKEKKVEDVENINLIKVKQRLKSKDMWVFGLLAILLAFIKFANSGSNTITYFQSSIVQMNSYMVAYSDFLYSFSQLFAGLIAGLVLIPKKGLIKTLYYGLGLALLYQLILIVSTNSLLLFFSQILAGFAYGICYNSLLAWALAGIASSYRTVNLALYQSFFALGIFYGDKVYASILSLMPLAKNNDLTLYQTVFIVSIFMSLLALVLVSLAKKMRLSQIEKGDDYAIL